MIWGGTDSKSRTSEASEVYDPQANTISRAAGQDREANAGAITELSASSPQDGDSNVAVNAIVALRFSRLVRAESVSSATVTLDGPDGAVPVKLVVAEAGRLVFLNPEASLKPGTSHTVSVSGVLDSQNNNVAFAQFTFRTTGTSSTPISSVDSWIPTEDWKIHLPKSEYESLPRLEAAPGVTALSGQVLAIRGSPLRGISLEVNGRRALTDSKGRFLLANISSGHQVLVIDGNAMSRTGKSYGRYEYGAEIKQGKTNKLSFTIWLTPIDLQHQVRVPSLTTSETVVKTPLIPGLELRLPPNASIYDEDHRPVTQISITPIPLDRPPFPLPFIKVPIYFTIQPGGAYIYVKDPKGPKGARLIYPNAGKLQPGMPFAFWNYNPDQNGWYAYGQGKVGPTGENIIPDPGVVIYEFSGAMVGGDGAGPGTGPSAGGGGGAGGGHPRNANGSGGDPVDLSSGLFVYNKTDFVLPDVLPLVLTRTYRPNDSWKRPFGIGTTHPYEMFVGGNGFSFGTTPYIDLFMPDGSRIHFDGVGNESGCCTSYKHTTSGTSWYGAVIGPADGGTAWQIRRRDGMIYKFHYSDGLVNPACQALAGIIDRYGNTITIDRNWDGVNCTINRITSPNGRYIDFLSDTSNRIIKATDNSGRFVQYSYDGSGRLATVTDVNGGVTTFTYNDQAQMTSIQDARGIVYLVNQYDDLGRVVSQTQADGSTYQFDWTGGSGTQSHFKTVGSGCDFACSSDPVAFRNCSGCLEGYSALVTQVNITDPRGNIRRVQFSPTGYITTDTYALGQPEQQTYHYSYSGDNTLKSVTDALGRTTTYAYDTNGNMNSVTAMSGTSAAATTTAEFDNTFSAPLTVTDPAQHVTHINYDSNGSLLSIVDTLQHSVVFTHNGNGQVSTIRDASGNPPWHFSYQNGDLAAVTDPLGNTVTRLTDTVGRVVAMTDALGHTTHISYNPLSQITSVVDSTNGTTSFTYDLNGNLLSVQDARQQGTDAATRFTYDNMDRLRTKLDPTYRSAVYEYDSTGNLAKFVDRRGVVGEFHHDGLNRLTFAGFGANGGSNYESTITYSYDLADRLLQALDSASAASTISYDDLNRRVIETTTQGSTVLGSITILSDAVGRRTSMTVGGQPTIAYGYDDVNRLTSVTQGASVTSIGYDNDGRRLTLSLPNGVTTDYGYDVMGRLTSLTYLKGTTVLGGLTYSLDAIGRRTDVGGTLARTDLPSPLASAEYDAANRLVRWDAANLSYDAGGNTLTDGLHSFTWNAKNQLASVDGANIGYDPLGRRQAVQSGTQFLYDGFNVVQELMGTAPVSNRVVLGTDEFASRSDSSATVFPLADGSGSVVGLADATGNIQTQFTYDPFGATRITGTSSGSTYQYTGRENDGNGLYYYRARYYNPHFARFISEDPIGFAGGLNTYAYAGNSPVNWRDPLGLYTGVDDAVFAGGGLIVGVAAQAFGDLLAGQTSSWQTYVGAAVGGAVGGELLLYTGPVAAGAGGGAAGNLVSQVLDHYTKGCSYSAGSFATATGIGAVTGMFPGYEVPGITQGRNSFNAVFKQMVTKFENGTASSVTAGTATEMFIGRAMDTGMAPGAVGQVISDVGTATTQGRSCGCQ